MTFVEWTLRLQRWVLAAMLLGSVVIIWPPALEPVMLPKVTFIVLGAVLLVTLFAARAVWTRRLSVPVSPVMIAVAVFVLFLLVATATSPSPWTSVIGVYSRYTGLVPYLCYIVVFLAVVRFDDQRLLSLLWRTALVALGLAVGYGLLQTVGWEPVPYRDNELSPRFSFFGNINFSAAWIAAGAALCLPLALDRSARMPWRLAAGVLLPTSLLYVLLVDTTQGNVAAAVGIGCGFLFLTTAPGGRVRGWAHAHVTAAVAAALAFAGGAAVLLAFAVGRLLGRPLDVSLSERRDFWISGWRIFRDNPLLGTGLDTYGHHFTAYRPVSHVLQHGAASTDSPHSVVLGMFTNGGVGLGVAYLAVVALVAVALTRGFVKATGGNRIALGGFGGVWLAFQAQSLVSFDVPPLALLHWISSGIIVALAWPPQWRPLALPGRAAVQPSRKRKSVRKAMVPASAYAGLTAVSLTALVATWFSLYPLRADLAAASAAPFTNVGRYDAAIARFERAAALNPAEGRYPLLAARGFVAAGQAQQALEASATAARRDPGNMLYALFAARQAAAVGEAERTEQWYREAVERDPLDPLVLVEAADFLLKTGRAADAETLLQRAADVRPEPAALVVLGRARLAQKDVSGARAALERALRLDPANEAAAQLLAQTV